jgi:hypothetical protein
MCSQACSFQWQWHSHPQFGIEQSSVKMLQYEGVHSNLKLGHLSYSQEPFVAVTKAYGAGASSTTIFNSGVSK